MNFGLRFNPEVCCGVFFGRVDKMAKATVSPLTVSWAASSGRVLCASLNTIRSLRDLCAPPLEETAASFRKALTQRLPKTNDTDSTESWRQTYLNILKDPAATCKGMDFDMCYSWSISFYYLTPIVDEVYLLDLHTRLVHVGYEVMDFNCLRALKSKGLMSCGCQTYLHRAFCVHCCADAVRKKIITGYPFDPSRLTGRGPGAVVKDTGAPGVKRKAVGVGSISE